MPPTDHPSGPQDVPEYILFVVNNANICFSPRQGPSSERRRKSRSAHPHQQQLWRSGSWHQDRSGEIFLTVSILFLVLEPASLFESLRCSAIIDNFLYCQINFGSAKNMRIVAKILLQTLPLYVFLTNTTFRVKHAVENF